MNPDSDEYYDEHSSSQELLMPDFPTSCTEKPKKNGNTISSRSEKEETGKAKLPKLKFTGHSINLRLIKYQF